MGTVATAKMSTPSRSCSSARGDEGYFEWRETMERRQLESEQKMQALLQETMRLREENVVLRIQVSSSGPPHDQQSRGQGVNSRPNLESVNPGTTRVIPDMRDERSWERPMPTYHAPQDESLDSTRLSSKRQRDKRPQLSDAMHARLGPQEPGKERPLMATTWEMYPNPLVAPTVWNNPPHQAVRQAGRNSSNEPPLGSISKRLDDMLSTPFSSRIIHYVPPRGFLVLKFSAYDGSSDPFDHIMHYRQLMTLDIGNDALLCKVFLASLQGQAFSWFHRLPLSSIDNFRDLLEAFVGQYLCSALHKQNSSTLQNIKMQENESLREFVK